MAGKRAPGEVRDAIFAFLKTRGRPCSVAEICVAVSERLGGPVPPSSVRSYLGANVGGRNRQAKFRRVSHGTYELTK